MIVKDTTSSFKHTNSKKHNKNIPVKSNKKKIIENGAHRMNPKFKQGEGKQNVTSGYIHNMPIQVNNIYPNQQILTNPYNFHYSMIPHHNYILNTNHVNFINSKVYNKDLNCHNRLTKVNSNFSMSNILKVIIS